MTFGERIKEAIKASPYTQKKIAELSKISETALGNYIKNKRTPDAILITKIAQFCDVRLIWLLTGKGEMKPIGNGQELNDLNNIMCDLKEKKISKELAKEKIKNRILFHEKELDKLKLISDFIESFVNGG